MFEPLLILLLPSFKKFFHGLPLPLFAVRPDGRSLFGGGGWRCLIVVLIVNLIIRLKGFGRLGMAI
jgi:hypothetical protein